MSLSFSTFRVGTKIFAGGSISRSAGKHFERLESELVRFKQSGGKLNQTIELPNSVVTNAFKMRELSKLEQNILNDVKDYSLKTQLVEISRILNEQKGSIPKDYKIYKQLEEIITSARHLDPQKDKAVCDELNSCLAKAIKNLNVKSERMFWVKFGETEDIIKQARDLAEIPLHANASAFPIKGHTVDALKYFQKNNNPLAKDEKAIDEAMRNESMINFFIEGKPSQELKDNLYKNYYLNRVKSDVSESLEAINKHYGTAVFVPKTSTEEQADDILREFHAWNRAGSTQTRNEKVVDFNDFDKNLWEENYGAYAFHKSNFIRSKTKYYPIDETYPIIRHEKMHINDSFRDNNNNLKHFGHFGKNEQYDFTKDGHILKEKTFYRNEFKNAGIEDWHIDYAYKNRAEFLAVAAEGDPGKYSDEFKQVLLELGMPDWFFNIRKYKRYN